VANVGGLAALLVGAIEERAQMTSLADKRSGDGQE
jgi:hypothetical protein